MGAMDAVRNNGLEEEFVVPKIMAKGLGFPVAKETHSVLSAMTPELIPLTDLHTDIAAFQWRKHEYSELSVQRIISDIKRGDFLFHMMDPVRVWKNPEDGRLYILAGHSRVEAFRRLSQDESLINDPNVQQFKSYWNVDFNKVPCNVLPSYLTFLQAKRIALNSNSLGSHHTLTERAYYYYEKRKLIELGEGTWHEYKKDLEHYEWANAKKIDSFSYLSPHGKLICLLDALERDDDRNPELMKVAYRTGILLKQFPELTSLHEQEMYEYLYEDGNYGTREGQFSTFEKFRDFVTLQMEQLRAANKFSANELINLRGAQRLSLSMQTYNKLMRALTEKKRLIQKQVTDRMRSLNASILNKTSTPSLFDEPIDDKLLEYWTIKQWFLHIDTEIKKICEMIITNDDAQNALKNGMKLIQGVQLEIQKLKGTKVSFILAGLQERTLFDQE